MNDQYIEVNGIKTRYWAAGDQGTPVVLVHGLGGYLENWETTIEPLARQHRVYAFDLVGFGHTDKPDAPYNMAYLGDFVRDFLDAHQISQAAVVGHSLGGALSLYLAITYPERVSKLTLVASGGFGRDVSPVFRLIALPLVGELLLRPSRSRIKRTLKVSFYDDSFVNPERIERGYRMSSLPGVTKTILTATRTTVGLFGPKTHDLDYLLNGMGDIQVPTLVVWGKQDPVVPASHADIARTKIPGSRVQFFDKCGHWPQVEHAEAFNQLVLDFLAESS